MTFFNLTRSEKKNCFLPHSSAESKRQFSVLSNMKTKLRNRVKRETVATIMHMKQMVHRESGNGGLSTWSISLQLASRISRWKQVLS